MHNPFLIGEKIYLRAPEASDAQTIAMHLSDQEVIRHIYKHRPTNADSEWKRIEEMSKSNENVIFAIVKHETNELVGLTGLHKLDLRHHTAMFGIYIGDKSTWGQGLATEATKLQLKYAFETLNLHRVELDVQEDNLGAIRVYEKAGFVKEGLKREAYWGNGRWQNLVLMAALNPHH